MLLGSRLSYDEQITCVVCTCITDLCQINRVKHILDKPTLIHIINAFLFHSQMQIFSRMYYCSSVGSNTAKKSISRLQIVTGIRKYDHVTCTSTSTLGMASCSGHVEF